MAGRSGEIADPSVKNTEFFVAFMGPGPSSGASRDGETGSEGIPVHRVRSGAPRKSEYP